jgi:hypothetical protein
MKHLFSSIILPKFYLHGINHTFSNIVALLYSIKVHTHLKDNEKIFTGKIHPALYSAGIPIIQKIF